MLFFLGSIGCKMSRNLHFRLGKIHNSHLVPSILDPSKLVLDSSVLGTDPSGLFSSVIPTTCKRTEKLILHYGQGLTCSRTRVSDCIVQFYLHRSVNVRILANVRGSRCISKLYVKIRVDAGIENDRIVKGR